MNFAFRTTKLLVLSLGAWSCAAPLPAQTQETPKKAPESKPAQRPAFDASDFVKKYDKNGDGKLDAKERQEARKERQAPFVKKYDKNGDGKLDDAERKAAREEFLKSRENTEGNAPKGKAPELDKKPEDRSKQPK